MTAQLDWLNARPYATPPYSRAPVAPAPSALRDAALARHEDRHAELLAHARRIAHELAARDGATC